MSSGDSGKHLIMKMHNLKLKFSPPLRSGISGDMGAEVVIISWVRR